MQRCLTTIVFYPLSALDLQRMQDGRLRIAVNRTPAKDLLISPIAMMKTFARSKSINIMLHCTGKLFNGSLGAAWQPGKYLLHPNGNANVF